MRHACLFAGLGLLAACASGGGATGVKWSASSWNGLAPVTIGTENNNFFAAPLDGQGFKLKLSLVTDGSFRIQQADDDFAAELSRAAIRAAPEGCTFVSLERTPDGGAEAAYDCA